jgi:hypothetical protein
VTQRSLLIALVLALLTLLGFFVFPGHTWLQSDTQIYVPMLERMVDQSLYPTDEVAIRPHVTWTLYDEAAIALRRLTGSTFQGVLLGQQILFRFLGLWGVYLLARALSLPVAGALLAAACFGLGATVNGPSVLTVEYEPVPRGFATALLMAAVGLAAHRRWWWAGALAAVATVYHPTSTAPFWAAAGILWLISPDRRQKWGLLLPAGAALAAICLFARYQVGETESQMWFGRITPTLEEIQKLRGAYNWIELWLREWLWQYPLLFVLAFIAWWRLRPVMSPEARFFTLALPVYGLLMVPLQYVLLDVGKWILIPQFQPARAVLFVTAMAVLLAVAAAWHAAEHKRWWESLAWFSLVFVIPANGLVLQLFTGGNWRRLVLVAALAALSILAVRRQWLVAAVALAATFLIPYWGGMTNYPALHNQPLRELSDWARAQTPRESVFLFADAGRGLQPGVFRAEALRGLYVDWKGGGQANLLKSFGEEWWRRWQAVHAAKPPLLPVGQYRSLGIDFLVVSPRNRPTDARPVYENKDWVVIPLNQ